MRNTVFAKRIKITVIAMLCCLICSSIFMFAPRYEAAKPKYEIDATLVNKYPIVLVHGFMGHGRESSQAPYWGRNLGDIQEIFNEAGFRIMTATVSPFSSNWHRACELYAYIKGGTVDYGEYTSKKLNHERYGRTYPGIYPEWDENHPIHILAHSQGGQTSRVLAHLVEFGFEDEINNTTDSSTLSPLFKGGIKKSIISITTLASPHDGTSFVYDAQDMTKNDTKKIMTTIYALNGNTNVEFFDYQLDHLNIKKDKNESLKDYFAKLNNVNERVFGFYDMSPEGAAELNSWVKDSSDIYYISYATRAIVANKNKFSKYSFKKLKGIDFPSVITGVRVGNAAVKHINPNYFDTRYFDNDGTVNTFSAIGPKLGSTSTIIKINNFNDFRPGVWNNMPTIECSHTQIIGMGVNSKTNIDFFRFYNNLFTTMAKIEHID